jgi:hypothetical protein
VCGWVGARVCVCACVCLRMCVCVCVCVCVHMCVSVCSVLCVVPHVCMHPHHATQAPHGVPCHCNRNDVASLIHLRRSPL